MKSSILSVLFIMGLSALSTAQEESFNDFKREFNRRDGIHSISVPGFLVRLAGSIAINENAALDKEAVRPLIRNLGSVSIIYTEDHMSLSQNDILDFKSSLLNEGFEPLLEVRDNNDHVEILSWGKKDIIKRLMIIINDDISENLIIRVC